MINTTQELLRYIILFAAGFLFTLLYLKLRDLYRKKTNVQHSDINIDSLIIIAEDRIRDEIAKELHDNVNSLLMIAKLNLEKTENENKHTIKHLEEAMMRIRDFSRNQSLISLEHFGLKDSLWQYIQIIEKSLPFKITASINLENEPDPEVSKHLFRIIQEAVTNAAKHSNASRVMVDLREENKMLLLEISDNGSGFNTNLKPSGMGVKNMQSRANIINARFETESVVNAGSTIRVVV